MADDFEFVKKEYGTKCRRCSNILEYAFEGPMHVYRQMISHCLKFGRYDGCKDCNKKTVQDLVSFETLI